MSQAPVFLISTGRTGTKYFSWLFQEFGFDVTAFHTTPYTRLLNITNNMLYLGLLPMAVPRIIWTRLKAPSVADAPGRYIECNPYYYNILEFIWKTFPEARIIFVTRHPRDFIRSHIRWERQRLNSRIANQLVPFWGPVGYHHQIAGMLGLIHQRVVYYSKVWSRKNMAIMQAIEGDSRARFARFEDLLADSSGVEQMTALFDWLNIPLKRPLDGSALRKRVNDTKPLTLAWDERCEAIMRRECGDLLQRLAYDDAY